MKKWIAWLMVLVCLTGVSVSASAEKGFETVYDLFSDEKAFGQPVAAEDIAETVEKVCRVVFIFDPDNNLTMPVLFGTGTDGAYRYCAWLTGYEKGAIMMSFLLTQFASLNDACEEEGGFRIGYTFDGGENTVDIATAEEAEKLSAILQQGMEDTEYADPVETP